MCLKLISKVKLPLLMMNRILVLELEIYDAFRE